MQTGNYFKLYGSYEGVVWTGKRWERFLCDGCVRQMGIAKGQPLQGPMSAGAAKALLGPVYHKHDVETHKAYLAMCKQKNHA